jgi:hypothetical protein
MIPLAIASWPDRLMSCKTPHPHPPPQGGKDWFTASRFGQSQLASRIP